MPNNDEAAPICRGKNLSWETIMLFYNNMPKEAMPREKFHAYVESNINGWTQTHSQIARQLALYYEKDGICYPRFDNSTTLVELYNYIQYWAHNYFIPNPYTPSLKGRTPTNIYAFLKEHILNGGIDYKDALNSIFGIELSSHDKVKAYLANYTDIVFDANNKMRINTGLNDFTEVLDPSVMASYDSETYFKYYDGGTNDISKSKMINIHFFHMPLQQIFYGAPGTGKSHSVCEVTKNLPKEDVFRITFHPDSDYASFVGCYKPTETEGFRYGINGANTVKMVDPDNGGAPLVEKKITYRFVPQAFINAYVRAYHTDSPVFLVIEEINRGNCAQIFGDMFQLLDRGDSGESDYAIKPDSDIQDYLSKVMADAHTDDEAIKQGVEMKLPANLFIWATMNTSDQSLFPIDSAFKRRWDWKYMPIDTTKEQWAIKVNGKDYSWGSFLEKVNNEIGETTSSEDKKLGFYFCKACDKTITAERFVSKVLFYIYNDVFKDYGLDSREFFKDKETGKVITFQSYFNMDGSVKEPQVEKILTNLGVVLLEGVVSKEAISEELFHEEEPLLDEDGNEVGVNNGSRDNSRYSLNGDGKYKKGPLALAALESFVQSHTDLSADEVYSEWKSLNLVMPSHFIENENEYNSRTSASNDKSGNKRCNRVTCGDGHVLYISTQWNLDSISVFIERVNAKDWGIHIEKTND